MWQKSEEQRKRIIALRNAIRALSNDNSLTKKDELYDDIEEEEIELEEIGEPDEDALPQPFFDDVEYVLRCAKCNWEVVEGQCQLPSCAQEHAYMEVNLPYLFLREMSQPSFTGSRACRVDTERRN